MLTRARKVGVGAGIAVAVGLAIAIAIVSRAPTASAKSAFEEKYQSWKWATSGAGDWGTHIWLPATIGQTVPFIIVVFDKP